MVFASYGRSMGTLSDSWLGKISAFRRSPSQYFEENNTAGAEHFLLDILGALCRENIQEHVKLQLLITIQEKFYSLLPDTTSVECAVGSLKDMFLHPNGHPSQLYLSQILVTGTSVLITSDLLKKHHEIFVDFVGVLTDTMDKVNNASNLLTRKAACECLWELELAYPGLFQAKLDHFYDKCAAESSPVFQSYLTLFVTVLHHAIEHLAANSFDGLEVGCLNELLTSRTEPLKPLYVPSQVSSDTFPVKLHSEPCGLPSMYIPQNVDSRELKRAISFLMENVSLLNSTGLFYVMQETFKSQFIHWVSTSDLGIFHMLLLMKLKFSMDMFQEQDDLLLLQRLLIRANQPTLPKEQRLLCYEWLMHFPEEKCNTGHAPVEPEVSVYLEDSQFGHFYPSPFDNIDILQNKLKLLCLCYWPSETQETDVATATLISCLALLNKQVELGIGGKAVQALFRILFWYYQHHSDTALVQEIYRLVLSVVTKHPKFMPFVVNFLDSVAIVTPESPFPVDLLRALNQHVVFQPVTAVLPNLAHHLKLLAQAMRETDIAPLSTIQFLAQILQNSEVSSSGNWNTGNCILAVCHSILLHHDTGQVIRDLGNLLLLLATTYQDIDIRDRARFYYSLLTNVSSEKASKILTSDATSQQSLPHVMADDITSTSFPVAPPVQHVQKPFLKLARVPQNPPKVESKVDDQETSSLGLQPYGLLGGYLSMVEEESWKPEIPIKYYIHYNSSSLSTPSRLYALVLQLHTARKYEAIPEIHLSSLSTANSTVPQKGCQQITIKFRPLEPVPALFNVRVMFNNEEGFTYSMVLEQLEIRFSDLFIPLTLPSAFQNGNTSKTKSKLFRDVWDHVLQRQRTAQTTSNRCVESVVCLSLEWTTTQHILRERLQAYIVDENDEQVNVGIFLPPRQHLLFKFTTRNQKTVVAIATDDWRALGLVESYLRELEEEGQRDADA